MSISPVVFNGMIQRTQDFGGLKQQEDSRPFVEQQQIGIHQQKEQERLARQVVSSKKKEDSGKQRFDAKEKGSNEYEGDQSKKKKQQEQDIQGGTGHFAPGQTSTFDMKA